MLKYRIIDSISSTNENSLPKFYGSKFLIILLAQNIPEFKKIFIYTCCSREEINFFGPSIFWNLELAYLVRTVVQVGLENFLDMLKIYPFNLTQWNQNLRNTRVAADHLISYSSIYSSRQNFFYLRKWAEQRTGAVLVLAKNQMFLNLQNEIQIWRGL